MDDEREQAGVPGEREDSFEALLKRAAHVSGPALSSLGPALQPGSTLLDGRLRIEQRIGEGGMGVVYRVHDAVRRGSVALKTLNRLDAGSVYRLKNEFRSLAEVSHPNLCRLNELFSEAGQWFFTMELVEGERFDRWVRPDAVLDLARLRAALPQLCDGIAAIHAAGKLHRDLKPSNVLVARDGRVVVLDFGLAVDPELGGVGQTVMDESVSGTPGYMAPEQAAGRAATAASDFYAVGVMLFEALTGQLPFEGRAGEMLGAKQHRDAPCASTFAADTPAELDQLCARLLARDPAARPSAEMLRAELGLSSAHGNEGVWQSRPSLAPRSPGTALAPDAAPELLGRDAELQALHAAFAASESGKAVVLFVSGESGMGKSALVNAFLDALRASSTATVLAGRCYERENVPFKGFDSLVDELSRHLRKLPVHEAAAVLPREVYALARVFPVLDRVPVVAAAPKKHVPDPQDLKRRAFDAFGELLARMRDRGPLCVFIDDVQWLDQDSVRFMRALFVHPDPVPALLVCAHRSEGAPDNALLQSVLQAATDNRALDVRTLALGPLPAHALSLLAERLLPGGGDAAQASAFAAETGGSPFFAVEVARASALCDKHAKLPSLADALALHVGALPAGAQHLLSSLALMGQPLTPALVIDATGLADGHSHLDQLRSEQLVRVSLDGDGERRVECYHDKIREHVVAALPALRVKELALGLSRALLADTRAEAHAEPIARCLELAGLREEAAVHAARAAEAAFTALAFERAAKLYTQALEYGQFDPERTQALRVAKAEALAHAGQGEQAAEAFIVAAQHANEEQAAELTRQAGEQYLLCGDLERGRALLAQALRRVGHTLPLSLPATLASVVWSRSRLRMRGLSFKPRAEHDAATLRELEALRMATHCLVRSDQLRAADFCARWLVRALDAGHALESARAAAVEIMFASATGAPEARIAELIALCNQLCEPSSDAFVACVLPYYRGIHRMMRLGRTAEAIQDFDRQLEAMAADPLPTSSYDRRWGLYLRAASVFSEGNLQETGELAQPQLENALASGDQTVIPGLSALVCYALLAADRPEQAERVMAEARASLRPGEVTLQYFQLSGVVGLSRIYQGHARDAWSITAPYAERMSNSFQGRVLNRGATEVITCGLAAAAAAEATDAAERRELARTAERLAKRALTSPYAPLTPGCPEAVLACLRGDRAGAIAALRRRLALAPAPFVEQLIRHRLGVLLNDAEGQALVREAEAFFRAGGVVNPERFVAAWMPGIAL